jgi:type IV pilus assembly protein PilY1
VSDVKISRSWRTVLVSGGRQGGASYFALDVTDGYSPYVMWQAQLPDGHAFASEVEFARIDSLPVALIGSGLNSDTGEAFLYAYSIESGHLIGSLPLSVTAGARNKATKPRAVDVNLDGETDLIYCADLAGKVWRADVNGNADPSSWDVSVLYSGNQPITAEPVPAFGVQENVYIYFGTGAYLEETDLLTVDTNSFYCVYDSHDGSEHTRFDLVDQTGGAAEIGTASGWYIDLWNQPAGERITEKATVVAGTVFVTSFAPTQESCAGGGHSWLYWMSYNDGTAVEDEYGGTQDRVEDLGDGVASRPVVDIVNETVIVQSSDATIEVQDIGTTFFHLNVRSWQENYDYVEEPPPSGDPGPQ